MSDCLDIYKNNISVIVICKNEERFIRNTIIAILVATSKFDNKEIIVVDSNSTDNTISILSEYPVTLLQLKENWRHTPAAGRYIGTYFSSGDYLLFLDGDSTLCNGFIEKAIQCFYDFPNVGAIIGKRKEINYDNINSEKVISENNDVKFIGDENKYVDFIGGSAIIKKNVLNVSGTYNPWIYSEEEGELSQRIKYNGFKILGIPVEMVVHHTLSKKNVIFYKQRLKNKFHLGPGQVLRYSIKNNNLSNTIFKKFFHHVLISIWQITFLFLVAFSFINKTLSWIAGWFTVSIIVVFYRCIKNRNILNTLKYLFIENIQGISLIRGFFITPLDPFAYPKDVKIITKNIE